MALRAASRRGVVVTAETPASTSAVDRWYETHSVTSDRPHVAVWMPRAAPTAYLKVRDNGCHKPQTLPDGPLWVTLRLGGVQFDGYAEEIELLLAAALELVQQERARGEAMRANPDPGVSS